MTRQQIVRFRDDVSDHHREVVLLLASRAEIPSGHTWGTGGWLPPAEREALDWLTLAKLLGWDVRVASESGAGLEGGIGAGSRFVIVGCDPETLHEDLVALIAARLETEPLLVVTRAASAHHPIARLAGVAREPERIRGRAIAWIGPGSERVWNCRNELGGEALALSPDTSVWATLDGAPLITGRAVGRGAVATLGFQPSEARDGDGAGTALLKHLLIWGAAAPVAWLDLEGTVVLRMDDPGGAQNVHLKCWCHRKLDEEQWAAVGTLLAARHARLSIAYVAGWIDDGDAERGCLIVDGRAPNRVPGRVYPSPLVKYHDRAGHAPGTLHDYEAEFRGVQALRRAGLADVELHGYTHMHPDRASWASAPDRYEAVHWFREFSRAAEPTIAELAPPERPLALAMTTLRRYFSVRPTTLVCPGDDFTHHVQERALGLGLSLVSSYYLALRHADRFCWSTHVCAPYLDQPDARWFTSGLPVVGYFHDRDLARDGVDWLARWLDRWREAGARRLIDFRELAAGLDRRFSLDGRAGEARLVVASEDAPALVRPLPIAVRYPGGRAPTRLSVDLDGGRARLEVDRVDGELGRVMLPASTSCSPELQGAHGIRDRSSPSGGAAPAPV
jgi:hypothetical protein